MTKNHHGSSFDSFLDEAGIKDEVDLRVKKKVLARQILARMKHSGITKTTLAERMKTSRSAVERLIDPDDTGITFVTLAKASAALDLNLLVSLEERPAVKQRKRR